MVSGSMITPPRFGRLHSLCVCVAPFLALVAGACEKVPLVAPSGSTITLTASTNALPANGSADIVANVLEPAGTPPHSGTHVIFTTTLGVIEPSEATTDINGRVAVKFLASGTNGTATITATSGGATTGANGAVKISVGTAAVGRITLTANPSTISASGGSSAITANVVDINGNALTAAPVSFATSAGALSSSLVTTDAIGNARTTLTTSVEATVTATVGVPTAGSGGSTTTTSATVTVKVNPAPNVSITAPGGTLTAGQPITFTLSVSPGTGSTAQIREVIINFGDGDVVNLGGITGSNLPVQHKFDDEGTYTVRATATDTLGGTNSAVALVVIQPQPSLGVTINQTQIASGGTTTVTFTATVTPATATVVSYFWTFGDGTSQTTTSNTVVHQYTTGSGVKIVRCTVTTTTGQTATGETAVNP
jgi:adhesin/invasin